MKSPFPGMDPYIEACGLWGDFHHDLISEIKYALATHYHIDHAGLAEEMKRAGVKIIQSADILKPV